MLAKQSTARMLLLGGPLVMAALLAFALSTRLGVHAPSPPRSSPGTSANLIQRPPPLRLVPGGFLLAPAEMPPASADVALTPPWPPQLRLGPPNTAHLPERTPG